MLVDYVNCTSYYENPSSYTTAGTAINGTTDNSECLSQSILVMRMFLIPVVVCSIVTLLVNPLVLVTILMKDKLRKETRYNLLANVMISDLIFLIFNSLISTCNAIRWYIHRILCFTMTVFSFAAYTSCVLTFTVMVIDTYIAICFPLHYHSLLSVQRTRKILSAIWIFSVVFPIAVFVLSESFNTDVHERQNVCLLLYYGPQDNRNNRVTIVCSFAIIFLMICSVMITYFYVRLYTMTRHSGIWASRFSRARITLLTHSILLCLYIIPAFILTTEVIMFKNNVIGMDVRLWISASNSCVIMLMPRALSPLLYGLRYREIYASLKLWFSQNKVSFTGTDGYR
ncbi:probable G-protein coupled receptor 148 [Rana temporaria]|uniref:probable G-protein coupled receptor 148 n=1 Tax=Rana temporaria TaxID=8407 RepID=UPI001AAC5472|nr:probable G-protein coupled receptor 148 [Rana temporaria]